MFTAYDIEKDSISSSENRFSLIFWVVDLFNELENFSKILLSLGVIYKSKGWGLRTSQIRDLGLRNVLESFILLHK